MPCSETISLKPPSSYPAYISDVLSCSRGGQELEENQSADLLSVILESTGEKIQVGGGCIHLDLVGRGSPLGPELCVRKD